MLTGSSPSTLLNGNHRNVTGYRATGISTIEGSVNAQRLCLTSARDFLPQIIFVEPTHQDAPDRQAKGARVKSRDGAHRTPLARAWQWYHDAMAELLRQHSGVQCRDRQSATTLRGGSPEVWG